MEERNKDRPILLSALIISAFLLMACGYYIAVDIENTQSNYMAAFVAWVLFSLIGLSVLLIAHIISNRRYNYNAIGLIFKVLLFLFIGYFGWIYRNSYYNMPFFSDYRHAEFTISQSDENTNHFLFMGKFSNRSGAFIISTIMDAQSVDWNEPISLELHSNGGSPQEAIILSEFVKHYNIHIEVMGKCISACAYVLLSSEHRFIHPRAWIGFHAVYLSTDEVDAAYDHPHLRFYNEITQERLREVGASEEFLKKALVKDAKGGFFPSYEELVESGVANRNKRLHLHYLDFPNYL